MIGATLMTCALLAPQSPSTSTLQVPAICTVVDAASFDVDADGQRDLVLVCHNTADRTRELRVHRRRRSEPAFAPAPSDAPWTVYPDAIAFTWCNCDDDPERELLLLTAEDVVLVERNDDGAPSYARLLRHPLVWPAATERCVALTEAVVDFDGDGDDDLLLPEPDGWSVYLQTPGDERGRFAERRRLVLPLHRRQQPAEGGGNGVALDQNSIRLRFRLGDGADRGPLVDVSSRTAPARLLDLDGDGRVDLTAWRNGVVHVGRQHAAGELTFAELPLPLPPDRLRLVDPAFSVGLERVDGDAHADLVLATSTERDGEVEVRIDVFPGRADGFAERSQRLRMQTLAMPPRLVDATGDGRADLVCATLRTSSLPDLPGSKSATLEVQLNVFANVGDGFAPQPNLARVLPLTATSGRRPFLQVRPGRRDVPGDVLMLRDGELQQRFLKRDGDALSLGSVAAKVAVPDDARVVYDAAADELLVMTDHEVRHVRFRR